MGLVPPTRFASLLWPLEAVVSVSSAVCARDGGTLARSPEIEIVVVVVSSGSAEVSGTVMSERETVRVLSMIRTEEATEIVTPPVVITSPGCSVLPPRMIPACVEWMTSIIRAEEAIEIGTPAVVMTSPGCSVLPPRMIPACVNCVTS